MSEREYYTREYPSGHKTVFYVEDGEEYHNGFTAAPARIDNARRATGDEIKAFEQEEKRRRERKEALKEQEREEAIRLSETYGFDPREVGNRPRGFWVEDGQLVICARDGGGNEPDCFAAAYGQFLGTDTDGFDCTYRYYRYAPVTDTEEDT